MNPTTLSSLPVLLDPVAAAVVEQLREKVEAKDLVISEKDRVIAAREQSLASAEALIEQLREALRLERIRKYGRRSEKLSDQQLQLLDLEPGVSSDEIDAEIASGPLPDTSADAAENKPATEKQRRARRNHPGRNELPAHLPRVEEIIRCTPEQCVCGKCGLDNKFIGYEKTEVLAKKPAEVFVRVILREKRACSCEEGGVATAPVPERIAPKSIFSDEFVIDFLVNKYSDYVGLAIM